MDEILPAAENLITTDNAVKAAVMDLGTNSFHLLVADLQPGGTFATVEQLHEAVKLGEGGINKDKIKKEAYARGIAAMIKFKTAIARHGVERIRCIGTSALRNAANGKDFVDDVKKHTGIQIELIDGQQEAAFIYQGVKASGCLGREKSLIMDIGGGSVEFILCDGNGIIWKKSFEIGAARLMDKFQKTDPISPECIAEMDKYLTTSLVDLFKITRNGDVDKLIGSAGAFETFAELVERLNGREFNPQQAMHYDFDLRDFIQVTNQLVRSTHAERAQNSGIIPLRVDMIVVASLLTRFVMDRVNVGRVGMSAYSLKEGVMFALSGN